MLRSFVLKSVPITSTRRRLYKQNFPRLRNADLEAIFSSQSIYVARVATQMLSLLQFQASIKIGCSACVRSKRRVRSPEASRNLKPLLKVI